MTLDEQAALFSRRFLQPYIDMPYPGSVRAVKTAVAAADDLPPEEARAEELRMFASRWGSSDNAAEIARRSRPAAASQIDSGPRDQKLR